MNIAAADEPKGVFGQAQRTLALQEKKAQDGSRSGQRALQVCKRQELGDHAADCGSRRYPADTGDGPTF